MQGFSPVYMAIEPTFILAGTKAWFNNREEGECSVEIELQQAILFIHNRIEKDSWLEEYFPKQMEVYHQAIEQTREQILGQLNVTL